ncbi:glycoside hydrolase family 32 protein [Agreia sp. COWG]|uniref:glycoside hydrolase family 32 protein n=1 Tax=Agreia sp. COWG TaxID=2773266 RepID=UPI001F4719DD|nr:glycoside hydrolase family 32 protein [Agreia sp. COWG]
MTGFTPETSEPDATGPRPARDRRGRLIAIVAAVVAVALVILAVISGGGPTPRQVQPTASGSSTDGRRFERPDTWSDYRPAFHLTPEANWMNDPQRPFYLDGLWHYYYLYNADYPNGNGTEWHHSTSTDLVHWKDEGVAIEKYRNGLGDIETGSAVVDVNNTAGFGAGAVIAVMTQQVDGVQRQSLFSSTDGGYTFASYSANPVMENPGTTDFRDPKIIWDDSHHEWVMVLAEGNKLGFYTSPDLKSWAYTSGFERSDLGTLECPDLFQMSVDGDPTRTRWVLAASANGSNYDTGAGFAYWTGEWDGSTFTADADAPQWLDGGADFYAAVTWDDPRKTAAERLSSRSAIGWMNNWAYAGDLPTAEWHGGQDSVVRTIRLSNVDGVSTLVSQPTDALGDLGGQSATEESVVVPEGGTDAVPQPQTGSYRLRVALSRADADPARQVRVKLKDGAGHFVTLGYDFERERVFIDRTADAIASTMPDAYRDVRSVSSPSKDGVVDLDVLVDYSSVEVFANGGRQTLSSLGFGVPDENGIRVESDGGAAVIRSFSLVPLAVAAPVRKDG